MRRVAITGAGTINALGHDVPTTLAALAEGRLGIGALDLPDIDRLAIRIGGQVKDFDPTAIHSRQELTLYDSFTRFGLHAAREAIAASGLDFAGELGERAGVVVGTGVGGAETLDENYAALFRDGKNRVHPLVIPKLMNNAAGSHISMAHGLRGPNFTVSTACSSSNHAMGLAFQLVRSGAATAMVTGGAEAPFSFGGIKAWEGLRVMSKDGCRPFSKTRNGMVQGEGAGMFVFEEWDHAAARGADILAEVIGFQMTSDASDIVMPSEGGAARAISGALKDAGLAPDEVGYINAHGTGTAANDRTECAAVRRAFGAAADDVMISSTKSMHGHLLGGTGAVELLACIMALRDGVVAPTIGYQEPDPACDLDVVPNAAREAEVEVAVSNAFAFGGLNAVLALRRV
ncbi:MAG: beta-ketoacyl-[acyl-carrier-protein] synthase family protein [Paracoccaceae bacterium]|nr:beta-ketoacyl-[acyl-carrier-protein] synthase family protein [Paracoccaceae bacterium]